MPEDPTSATAPIAVLYGTETFNAEGLAQRTGDALKKAGLRCAVIDMENFDPERLRGLGTALVITSTYGNGDPPANAEIVHRWLMAADAPRLDGLRFSVCGLGDTTYPMFAQCGKDFDRRLGELGGARLHPRQDCDVDYEAPWAAWLKGVLGALTAAPPAPAPAPPAAVAPAPAAAPADGPVGTRKHPATARVRVNRPLTGAGAEREVRHLELDLMGAPLSFQVGDSFGLHAPNDPAVVAEVLAAARAPADAPVRVGDDTLRLDDALRERFELTSVDPRLLTLLDGAPELPSDPSAEPHVVDVLRHAGRAVAPQALVDALRRLAPRLYSLASSPLAHPGEAHFTASVVDYEAYGRHRMGVATGWMAQRLPEGALIQVHVQPAPAFRLAPPEVDVVMIGPGTGIAPFRAFLQERSARRGRGRSWLFFGSRHEAQDALYADELAAFRADGVLSRLDLAWSRDQPEKVYVQDRMLAAGAELWAWLQGGAHIYVCGDASRMAPDVHRALQQIAAAHGGMDAEAAKAWVKGLAQAGRYQRDVY